MGGSMNTQVVVTTATFPGYWGVGEDIDTALQQCRAAGGRKGEWIVYLINPFYKDAGVHPMFGEVTAFAVDPHTLPRSEWPPVIAKAFKRGIRGKMTELTKETA